jgi:Skp family chaperone for outer membrane proteins
MKGRKIVFGCIFVSFILLTAGHESSGKESKPGNTTLKIAVVSIRSVFQDSKKSSEHQKKLSDEQNRIVSELGKLSKEIETLKAELVTRKPGSSDYSKLMLQMMDKQAQLSARKEFHQQEMALKDQQWTEQLYKDIIKAVEQVAKKKGLDIVLAKEELDFPSNNQTELMLAIRTNKLLYSSESLDITKEVVKLLNSQD